jgi:hypothetical protein
MNPTSPAMTSAAVTWLSGREAEAIRFVEAPANQDSSR